MLATCRMPCRLRYYADAFADAYDATLRSTYAGAVGEYIIIIHAIDAATLLDAVIDFVFHY